MCDYDFNETLKEVRRRKVPAKANDNLFVPLEKQLNCEGNFAFEDEERLKREALPVVEAACENLLEALIIDVDEDHNTKDTAARMARMFVYETFRGRYEPMPCITEFPNAKNVDQIYTVGPITIRSACSHHFVPIMGQLWVGILPNKEGRLLGLSKFARLADWIFRRPQIQEEATQQYAQLLENILDPRAVGVVVRAEHLCTSWRGVEDPGSSMITSVMLGHFRDEAMSRQEFFNLIKGQGF